jgi:hypothetical protein
MELHVISGLAKGHRSLGADRARSSCGPARGRDGVAAGAKPPSVSSISTIELPVVDRPDRGHRSLGIDREGGSCGPPRGRVGRRLASSQCQWCGLQTLGGTSEASG